MTRRRRMNDVQALRTLYAFLRRQPSERTNNRGYAWFYWQRLHGPTPTTFIVSGKGECIPWNRAALIATYRDMLLRDGHSVSFVATFDRTDI